MASQGLSVTASAALGLRVMWALTIVMILFVILRLVVRTFVVRRLGPDDHTFFWAGVCGFISSVLFQLACDWGFDSDEWSYSIPNFAQIRIAVTVAGTFIIIGLTLAKISVGIFLFDLALERWQRNLLRVLMGLLIAIGITNILVGWFQCKPVQALWDTKYLHTRKCINIFPMGAFHGIFGACYDFTLSIIPWVLIWPHTKLSRKDKLQSCLFLSMGFFAGICALGKLWTQFRAQRSVAGNYELTLAYLVWGIAELMVVMICVATPAAIRPLLMSVRRRREASKAAAAAAASSSSAGAPMPSDGSGPPGAGWINLDSWDKDPNMRSWLNVNETVDWAGENAATKQH